MSQDVVFRRIKGRIIPIKINKQVKDAAAGAGYVAAGVGVASAAGAAYRSVNNISTRASSRAFRSLERIASFAGPRQGSFFSMASKAKAEKKALSYLNNARKLGSFAAPLRLGGQFFGAALAGSGAAKLYEGVKGEKASTEKAAAIGSIVGAGSFLTGAYGGAGLRTAGKPLFVKAYHAIRNLKALLKL